MTTKTDNDTRTDEDGREFIDLTPTWAGLLPSLLHVHANGTPKGARIAAEELARMADAADKWNDHCKEQRRQNIGREIDGTAEQVRTCKNCTAPLTDRAGEWNGHCPVCAQAAAPEKIAAELAEDIARARTPEQNARLGFDEGGHS